MPDTIHDVTACKCAMCESTRERETRHQIQKKALMADTAVRALIAHLPEGYCLPAAAAAYCSTYDVEV